MNILHLTLSKKWFDMILSGDKKEEYREFKEYWVKRFGYYHETSSDPADNGYWDMGMNNLPDVIRFTNGYGNHRPTFDIEVLDWQLAKSEHPEWGGDINNFQFIFCLGKIISPQLTPSPSQVSDETK